jgi:hypothetical protein
VTRLTFILAGVEVVTISARRENHMAGRKEEDPVAFAAFADIEAFDTFKMRSGFGSNPQTECGSKSAAYGGSWVTVNGADVVKELRTSGPGEDRLPECNLNVGDLRLRENLFAADGRDLGVDAGECPGHHAYPEEKGTGFLSGLGEGDRVSARPLDGNGIKVLVDLST